MWPQSEEHRAVRRPVRTTRDQGPQPVSLSLMPTPATINAVCYHPCRAAPVRYYCVPVCATMRSAAERWERQGAMPTIRRATLDDLPVLTRLRIALFRDMGVLHDDEGLEPLTQ